MHVELTCTDCGATIQANSTDDEGGADGPVECPECGVAWIVTITRLS